MKRKKTYRSPAFILRGPTNNGDPCKYRMIIYGHSKKDIALIIYKFVLSDNRKLYEPDFINLRSWKDKYLFLQVFAIRLETFNKVFVWLRDLTESLK
jgi:hypothetical protein